MDPWHAYFSFMLNLFGMGEGDGANESSFDLGPNKHTFLSHKTRKLSSKFMNTKLSKVCTTLLGIHPTMAFSQYKLGAKIEKNVKILLRVILHTRPRVVRRNDLGFTMVIVSGLKIVTIEIHII